MKLIKYIALWSPLYTYTPSPSLTLNLTTATAYTSGLNSTLIGCFHMFEWFLLFMKTYKLWKVLLLRTGLVVMSSQKVFQNALLVAYIINYFID